MSDTRYIGMNARTAVVAIVTTLVKNSEMVNLNLSSVFFSLSEINKIHERINRVIKKMLYELIPVKVLIVLIVTLVTAERRLADTIEIIILI
jgi:hypothetical protein